MRILALTLWPEWAWAICYLGKRVENRGWKDDRLVGSYLALHAGKSVGGAPRRGAASAGVDAVADMALRAGWEVAGRHLDDAEPWVEIKEPGSDYTMPLGTSWGVSRGAVVAVAKVTGFVAPEGDGGPWHVPGQWGWQLDEVVVLGTPVAARGHQRLWRLPPELLEAVRREYRDGWDADKEIPPPRRAQ